MQQKYELTVVLHGDTEITNPSTSLLSSYLHRPLLSALVVVRFGPLFTLACWRDFVVTAQGATALLFLVTYFIEWCNHLGNSENLVFIIALSYSHGQISPTYYCWLDRPAGFWIYLTDLLMLENYFSCFVWWMHHILVVSVQTFLEGYGLSGLLTWIGSVRTVFMHFPAVSNLDLLVDIRWIQTVYQKNVIVFSIGGCHRSRNSLT